MSCFGVAKLIRGYSEPREINTFLKLLQIPCTQVITLLFSLLVNPRKFVQLQNPNGGVLRRQKYYDVLACALSRLTNYYIEELGSGERLFSEVTMKVIEEVLGS